MTWFWYTLGVLFVIFGIGFSIAWHELGHLIPAKRFGVRVPQYMVGFGPTVWSRRRGDTEYGLKAIPMGGYIRMVGMYPPRPEDGGRLRATSTGRFSMLVDEARRTALEEIRPGDENRVFYKLSVPKKLAVMLGGPLMNFVLAVALLTLALLAHGTPVPEQGARVETVAECVMPWQDAKTATTCGDAPATPARLGGILPGDIILRINGHTIADNRDVGGQIRPRVGQPTEVLVQRGGSEVTLSVTPISNVLPVIGSDGQIERDAAGAAKTVDAGFLGITSSARFRYQPQPITAVPGYVGDLLVQTASGVLRIPEKMVGIVRTVFTDQQREIDSPMSPVGVGRVAGEAASGKLARLIGENPTDIFFFLVTLLASLNLMLFLFNLIPLLPLDGGQVAGALWEGVKRRAARLRGRPDPGPVDVAKALPIAYGVSLALMGMFVLLVWADLVKPIQLGG